MAASIGFYHADVDQAAQILLKMWQCFERRRDTGNQSRSQKSAVTRMTNHQAAGSALDAKISLDDNAAFRRRLGRFVDRSFPTRSSSASVSMGCITCICTAKSA